MTNTTETLTNATVYFDAESNPENPGWVCETAEGQFQMDTTAKDASDETLLADARSFADGEIKIRRSSIPTRFKATYRGDTLGWYDSAEEAELAIQAAEQREEQES